MAEEPRARDDREHVEALARGLAVLEAFDRDHAAMTLSETAARTGLSPATARRCLLTLEALGYVRQEGRRFALGPRVLGLASAYLRAGRIDDLLLPELRRLVDAFGDAASVAVLDGGSVLYLAHLSRQAAVRPVAAVGDRYPAQATALGKALLAFDPPAAARLLAAAPYPALTDRSITTAEGLRAALDAVRAAGHATAFDELDYGIASLAVPVLDAGGRAVAAVNSSGYSGRLTEGALVRERLGALQEAARAIGDALARHPMLRGALAPGG